MRKYSLILLLFLLACKKAQPISPGSPDQTGGIQTVGFKPYLVGKWKLAKWFNSVLLNDCNWLTHNDHDANWYNVNIVLELKSNGIARMYKNDTLNHVAFATSYINVGSTEYYAGDWERYYLDGGTELYFDLHNTYSAVSMQTVGVGDTIMILNPFVDINFTDGHLHSICEEQWYVKIE